jgi:hypothetical protein
VSVLRRGRKTANDECVEAPKGTTEVGQCATLQSPLRRRGMTSVGGSSSKVKVVKRA